MSFLNHRGDPLIRRTVCAGAQFSGCSSTTNVHIETEQMAVYFQNLTSGAVSSGWSTPRPDRFIPGRDPIPTVQEAGWDPGPVWTGAENIVPIGIRTI